MSDAIMMGTTHLAGLYVGRLFIGLANGFFMTFSQLYLQVNSLSQCLMNRETFGITSTTALIHEL